MTGTLQTKQLKDGEYYYIVLYLYENGKRKPKWIATGMRTKGNKKKAEQLLRQTLREYELEQERQERIENSVMFSNWVKHWLYDVAAKRVDAVTFYGYEGTATKQVIPYFEQAGLTVEEITTRVLQRYIDEMAYNGRKDGKGGLSYTSLRLIRNALNQSLKLAVRNEMITRNPCDGLVLPKRECREITYFTEAQIQQLLRAIKTESLCPLIHFDAMYGLRRSELLGLQWNCVDFEAKQFTVCRTVVQKKTVIEKEKTKNASSRRTLPLTPQMIDLLTQLKAQEKENRRLFGTEYTENDYIFKCPNGQIYYPQYITYRFAYLLKQHGFPHIRFHDLRHSCASMLIANGFTLKDVQDWLGHSDITMTANIYAHLDMSRKREIANSLARIW